MPLILKAPAKINLFLEIKNKRDDGYHNLQSIMQTVALYDELSFEPSKTGIFIEVSGNFISNGESNLVYKAAKIVKDCFNIDKGAVIYLRKRIPIGAGLGGGSSDAASAILGLIKLWNIKTTKQFLEKLAARLGADVPFFLTDGTALCEGIGDVVTPLKILRKLNVVLVNPDYEVSTSEAYKKIKFIFKANENLEKIKSCIADGTFNKKSAFDLCFNRFEEFIFPDNPEIVKIKNFLRNLNCASFMSGSGATVFGIFDNESEKEFLQSQLSKTGWKFWFAEMVNSGCCLS
jgi:4-diphosphocytidyl-2-C-methyl-D-erythritol kinase